MNADTGLGTRRLDITNDLTGKNAVITGGSSGIGAAAALMLADLGARIAVGYHRREEAAQSVLRKLRGNGHYSVQLALEDIASVEAMARNIGEKFDKVDILVNSAGFTRRIPHGDLEALDIAWFDAVMTASVRGPFSVIRALLPLLRKSGEATVVNVSSISGFTGSGSSVVYCASKAALDNMTVSLGRALGPEIRVVSVSPGAVATDFVPGRDRAALEAESLKTPLKKVVEADDVALAIVAAVTHLRRTTGARIIVDGGRHL
jgi:3-oxoacyl-[acyl-carrier protein] reductase